MGNKSSRIYCDQAHSTAPAVVNGMVRASAHPIWPGAGRAGRPRGQPAGSREDRKLPDKLNSRPTSSARAKRHQPASTRPSSPGRTSLWQIAARAMGWEILDTRRPTPRRPFRHEYSRFRSIQRAGHRGARAGSTRTVPVVRLGWSPGWSSRRPRGNRHAAGYPRRRHSPSRLPKPETRHWLGPARRRRFRAAASRCCGTRVRVRARSWISGWQGRSVVIIDPHARLAPRGCRRSWPPRTRTPGSSPTHAKGSTARPLTHLPDAQDTRAAASLRPSVRSRRICAPAQGEAQPWAHCPAGLELAQDRAHSSMRARRSSNVPTCRAARADQDELVAVEAVAQLRHARVARPRAPEFAPCTFAAVLTILQRRLLPDHPRQPDRAGQRVHVPVVHADLANSPGASNHLGTRAHDGPSG